MLPNTQVDPGARIRPGSFGDPATPPFHNAAWPFFVAGQPDPQVPGITAKTGPMPAPAGPQAGPEGGS